MTTNDIAHHDDPTSPPADSFGASASGTGTSSTGTSSTGTGTGTWFTGPCDEAPARPWTKGRIRIVRAATVAGAAGAALAVWAVAVPLAGATLAVRMNGATQQVGPAAVAGTALLAGLAGWLLLAVLERFGRRPGRTWAITAGVLMGASLAGPLHSGVGGGAAAALAAMHLAVAAVLITVLPRTARC
ncbi:MAG TPA: DUF6069 family protein [Streptosporangiaceae bacterium]|nr:DUF6069 family protein [Streptosporangiaceae bacterium]